MVLKFARKLQIYVIRFLNMRSVRIRQSACIVSEYFANRQFNSPELSAATQLVCLQTDAYRPTSLLSSLSAT